jgi:ribonuclease HII
MTPRDERTVAEIRELLSRLTGRPLQHLAADLADDDRSGVAEAIDAARARERAAAAERARVARLYRFENQLRNDGYLVVAGVDEVGRGALAGPLSAGACVLPARPHIAGVDDSKRLTAARRQEVAFVIREVALSWSVAHVGPDEVDSLGVTAALRRVMGRALSGLELEPDRVVLDGRPMGVSRHETAVVKGDSRVAAVAAASILAKVARDEIMVSLGEEHPSYGFAINKGYGTAEHLDALGRYGLSPVHRRTFSPGGGTSRLF